MVDLYCERIAEGYLGEPVNALSNIAFVIAALYAWKETRKRSIRDIRLTLLIVLMVAIALGSLSFHVFANRPSHVADLTPIFMFQVFYLWLYCQIILGLSWPVRVMLSLTLLACIWLGAGYEEYLNGSVLYAPTLMVLVLISVYHAIKPRRGFITAISALTAFCLALVFRTLDNELCKAIDIGSHFLWHLLNGIVVYTMFKLLVINWVKAKISYNC